METLGGFSVVRQLGIGPRAEIWLGHDGQDVAALKVYRPTVQRGSIDSEIEALGRASSRHLLRLKDLASMPDGTPCIVFERLSALTLGHLLARRRVDAGEAVTILAPMALAVAELHRVGVAHNGVRPGSVLFDDDGAPVLACFGASRLIGEFPDPPGSNSLTIAQRADHPAVAEDFRQLAELATVVLGEVKGGGVEGGAELGRWLENVTLVGDSRPLVNVPTWPDSFAEELADRLFSLASPAEVRLSLPTTSVSSDAVPSRLDGSGSAISGPQVEPERASQAVRPTGESTNQRAVFGMLALPASVEEALNDWRASARRVLGTIRPRVWILVGALALLGIVAASLLFGGRALSAPSNVEELPAASPSTPVPHPDPVVGHASEVAGDDPLPAATALLALRAHCFAQRSILCLDGVDQADSAAMDADSHAIRLVQQGAVSTGVPDFASAQVRLVERLGDSALLSVYSTMDTSQPVPEKPAASLLLVKGEAGWLIRDLVAADQDASS